MTVTSRRLARRCRERLANNRGLLPCPSSSAESATVSTTDTAFEARLEKVDAAK